MQAQLTVHQAKIMAWLAIPGNMVHVTVYWGFDGKWNTYARCYMDDKTLHLRKATWAALKPYLYVVYENAMQGITFRRYCRRQEIT